MWEWYYCVTGLIHSAQVQFERLGVHYHDVNYD